MALLLPASSITAGSSEVPLRDTVLPFLVVIEALRDHCQLIVK